MLKSGMPILSGPTTLTCSSLAGSPEAASWPTSRSTMPDGAKSGAAPAIASPVERSSSRPETLSGPPSLGARFWMSGDGLDPAVEIAEHPVGEFDQRRLGGALLGELRVEELLARPRGLAERLQADHPRAALERMEGAPQRRQQFEVARIRMQLGAG